MDSDRDIPRPTVLLHHALPDGSGHVDWMIARDADGVEPLMTFRVPRRLDDLVPGETLPAERIGDHRPAYLAYEGPISSDRGTVRRLREGRAVVRPGGAHGWDLEVRWSPAGERAASRQRLRLGPQRDGTWCLHVVGCHRDEANA